MGGEADISEELLESIQDAVGRNVKICMRKKVQLEVKGDKLENRILALAPHRAFLLSARVPVRAEQTFSLFDIQAVDSSKPNQLMLDYDKGQLSLKLTSTEEVDEVIAQIGTSIQEHCPGLSPERVMKKLSLKPAERLANLHALWENNPSTDTGPCGAFSRMYWCVCDQLGLPFREEVQWDVDTIYLSQDTRELNLQDFIHLENRDLLAIVAVLEYNQWFTKLSLKDYKLSTDLCDQILRVVSRSGRLEELVLENTGLKADFAQKLASALSQNTDSALHTLNLANNSLEDKGIAYLSSSMGKLRCGLKVLNLSRNSLSAKGVNILAQALCSNPSVFSALAHLDLSGNSLRGDDMPSLWNFLGQPNKLQILDLCNCDCSLDLVCSSLLRGSLKHLTVLSMSKSVFNLKKGKELPSSFKQFFSSAQALNSIVLSGTKLPLEALKKQQVRLGKHTSDTRTTSIGVPQGCVLSPLLFSLYTNDCVSKEQSVKILKFADDTTVIGLINNSDESAYRHEVDQLISWCNSNHLLLNTGKTVEMVIDFRRNPSPPPPLIVNGSEVSMVESLKFLGTTISRDLKWERNTVTIAKKAQQRLYFLRQLKKFNLPQNLMVQFYSAIIEAVLTSSITIWFGSSTSQERTRLQRIVRTAEKIIGRSLPSLQDIYHSRVNRRTQKITSDPSHPGHHIFQPLPSGRRFRAIKASTTRHANSFFPRAVALSNRTSPSAP